MQVISPNMDICCELQKLPAVFAHFQEHKAVDGDNFLQFVYEDLFNAQGTEDGHHEGDDHEDLPFNGNHHCSHAPVAFVTFQLDDLTILAFNQDAKYGTFHFFALQGYIDSPFQPPKG